MESVDVRGRADPRPGGQWTMVEWTSVERGQRWREDRGGEWTEVEISGERRRGVKWRGMEMGDQTVVSNQGVL